MKRFHFKNLPILLQLSLLGLLETVAYNGQTIQNVLIAAVPAQKFEMSNQVRAYLSDMLRMK